MKHYSIRQISPECLDVLNFLRLQRYHKKKYFKYGIAYISKKDAKDVLKISYSTLKKILIFLDEFGFHLQQIDKDNFKLNFSRTKYDTLDAFKDYFDLKVFNGQYMYKSRSKIWAKLVLGF